MTSTIFVVDDNITNLEMAAEVLGDEYRVLTMTSAKKMFSMFEKIVPDMILLDIEMPEMNGMEALVLLKDNPKYSHIPVIFLTSLRDPLIETKGFDSGAVDFISKPFSDIVLKIRIRRHLDIDNIIRIRTQELKEKTKQLEMLRNGIISVLADVIEKRDKGASGHIERVTAYANLLIGAMAERNIYVDEISSWDLELIFTSLKMHDIGKLAISDFVLNKQDKLTDEEFTYMQTHVQEGIRIIDDITQKVGHNDLLMNAYKFAAYHHEKWNGGGYPFKVKGSEIPLQSRVLAIIDTYDALTTERSYKKALTSDEAVEIIKSGAGTQFDPVIVDVFYEVRNVFAVMCDWFNPLQSKKIS